jgi:hypothetical protein
MLEEEIIKLREAIVAMTEAFKGMPIPEQKDWIAATAPTAAPAPIAAPEMKVDKAATATAVPSNQELQSLCAALVRKDPEWRSVIKEHLSAKNAAKVNDLSDADKVWFKEWTEKELG